MLSKPQYGWVTISIDNWHDRASYLSDIHLDFLSSLINSYLKPYQPACVHYDAEGWEGVIVIDDYFTYVILDNTEEDRKFKSKVLTFEINKDDLAKELIEDIEENLEEWSLWDVDLYDDELGKKEENKEIIQSLLYTLKEYLKGGK